MKSTVLSICALLPSMVLVACKSPSERPAAPPEQPPSISSSIPSYDVVQVTDGGSISGVITVSGATSKLPKREIKKDPQVCGAGTRDSQQLIVSPDGGLKNVIVMVQDVKRGKAVPAAAQAVEIDQKNCEYTPHVMAIPVNADIAVRNSDPLLHNIHFYENDDSLFNIAQPSQGQVNKRKLDKIGMVYAECDVHGWMQGHIAVVDNPYFAITDDKGKFSITDLPPGAYKVRIWHEYLGEKTADLKVNSKSDTALTLDLRDMLAAKNPTMTEAPAAPAGDKSADKKAGPGGKEVLVKMVSEGASFKYEPAEVTIKVGTTVKWLNDSDNRHTATDDPNFEKTPGEAVMPKGAEAWTSPFLTNGDSFTRTFRVPGKYKYFCRNHGQFGMEGTITVVP